MASPDPRRVWTEIAREFAATRPTPWPQVLAWVRARAAPPARVLDLGAGNARHAAALSREGYRALAVDFARPFAETARAAGVPAVLADATALPLRAASADLVVFVASLHNIPGEASRVAALREVARALAPGGEALVTVWVREGLVGDHEIPWRGGARRYYHFYTPDSLARDAAAAGLVPVEVTPVRVNPREAPDNLFMTVAKR